MRMKWLVLSAILLGGLYACSTNIDFEPPIGASEFVSANGQAGQQSRDNGYDAEGPAAGGGDKSGQQRTVEQGDIYRLLDSNTILNLNYYRGFQVIDISDLNHPVVAGRAAISGQPVEMYAVDNFAIVLLNNWTGYYGSREDVRVEPYQGGLVLAIDITDRLHPVIVDRARVPGYIQASRLTRGGGQEALFVAASNWNGDSRTVVRSFAIAEGGRLIEKTTLDLGGYVIDIQATPRALLVARQSWESSTSSCSVSVIDISSPEGVMIEGAAVEVAGQIRNKFNMDLYRDVLRISSGTSWSGTNTNHLETFDVSDIQNPRPVDHATFSDGEQLYASLFLDNRAFLVTYRRVDPLHAFAIDDAGHITPKFEYVISGWNDYFFPVAGGSRMLGVGVDDQGGRQLAVSLYDISNLDTHDPFIAREAVQFDYAWSEAQWDDRAVSVLEGATSVAAADGTLETGLLLLPFSGYRSDFQQYATAVQIFSFSDTTLSRRGLLEHDSQVRRSFQPQTGVTANLSESSLSLHDTRDPGSPAPLGSVELAPAYNDFLIFGEYGARVKGAGFYDYWWGANATARPNRLEIVPLAGDVDTAEPAAAIDIDPYAAVHKVGDLVVTVRTDYVSGSDPVVYQTQIRVIDLADPLHPRERGTLTTDRIQPYGYYYGYYPPYYGEADVGGMCRGCGYYGYYGSSALALSGALVFPEGNWESELLGIDHVCYRWPVNESNACYGPEAPPEGCDYYTGSIACHSKNGGPTSCEGRFELCERQADGDWTCREVNPSSVPSETSCYDYELRRYWQHFTFEVLDLRDPDQPSLLHEVAMPSSEDDVALLQEGERVFVTLREPYTVPGDGRDYARYYFKAVDFGDLDHPSVSRKVNIPGELLAVEGQTLYTRDFVWGENIVETAVNKLLWQGDQAYLQARKRFVDEDVRKVLLDGAGHILVMHGQSWYLPWYDYNQSYQDKLAILDTTSPTFAVLSDTPIDSWASLMDAKIGRALFMVSGGLLVVNVERATAPYAQAYFPIWGWPNRLVVEGRTIFVPAGPFGMLAFDIDEENLLAP